MLQLKTEKGEVLAELDRERTAIGRDPANEVVLEDTSVSGFHAVILNDRGAVSIVDLGSTNGTAIDGQRLHERTPVKAWCGLQLGGVKLQVTDTETREPTRVQPIVSAAALESRAGAQAQRPEVRPAVESDTRVVSQAPEAPTDRLRPPQRSPAVPQITPSPPLAASPTVAPDSSPRTGADAYALFGGYPRGLGWLLFSFKGRVRRSLFWKCWAIGLPIYWIPYLITVFILGQAGFGQDSYRISQTFYWLLMIGPWTAILAKRIRDSGRRPLPWCAVWVFLFLLGLIGSWFPPSSSGGFTMYGLLSLLLAIPVLYFLYLVAIKRGDDGDNGFGDQNPRTGIVFG